MPIIVKVHIKPWLSKGLMKSINTKNKLYFNQNFKPVFIRYCNKLTTVIHAAKQQYYKNILNSVKTNC